MQIVITVGEEGRATAQTFDAGGLEETTGHIGAEGNAIDAGPAPAFEENMEATPRIPRQSHDVASAAAVSAEAEDGGAAPAHLLDEGVEPAEPPGLAGAESPEDTPVPPVMEDEFPVEPGTPHLRPVT